MTVLYKYSYLQKHSSCANLLLFKNVWRVPILPIPIYICKACIKINFGVGKLLYVLPHIVFLCLFIYLQKFFSLQNSTEVYTLKSTMYCNSVGCQVSENKGRS